MTPRPPVNLRGAEVIVTMVLALGLGLALLTCLVMVPRIGAPNLLWNRCSFLIKTSTFYPWYPVDDEGEFSESSLLKSVFVFNDAPHKQAIRRSSSLDRFHVLIWNPIWRDRPVQTQRLETEHDALAYTDQGQETGKSNEPPIGRRFVISLCLFLGGFFLSLRGWENFDRQGRLVSAAYIGTGTSLSACGLAWWLLL